MSSSQLSENAGGLARPVGDNTKRLAAGHAWIYVRHLAVSGRAYPPFGPPRVHTFLPVGFESGDTGWQPLAQQHRKAHTGRPISIGGPLCQHVGMLISVDVHMARHPFNVYVHTWLCLPSAPHGFRSPGTVRAATASLSELQ